MKVIRQQLFCSRFNLASRRSIFASCILLYILRIVISSNYYRVKSFVNENYIHHRIHTEAESFKDRKCYRSQVALINLIPFLLCHNIPMSRCIKAFFHACALRYSASPYLQKAVTEKTTYKTEMNLLLII